MWNDITALLLSSGIALAFSSVYNATTFILDETKLTLNSLKCRLKCSWNVIKIYSITGYMSRSQWSGTHKGAQRCRNMKIGKEHTFSKYQNRDQWRRIGYSERRLIEHSFHRRNFMRKSCATCREKCCHAAPRTEKSDKPAQWTPCTSTSATDMRAQFV
jgi:hypothetical protein